MTKGASSDPDDGLDDELRAMLPRRRFPMVYVFVGAFLLAGTVAVVALYSHMPQRGISLSGEGYIVVQPNGVTWLLFTQGTAVEATPESARRLNARTGPCRQMNGSMRDPLPRLDLESLDCDPGAPIVPAVVSRLHWLGVRFGYWGDGVQPMGDPLETALRQTPEVVAAMIDPRADEPQLIPLYPPLYPASLQTARDQGLPPPVLISVHRNDLILSRLRPLPLAEFLHRDRFVFVGAGVTGGWLVRDLVVVPDGTPSLERLLVAPDEEPWPRLMGERILRVARREQTGERRGSDSRNGVKKPENAPDLP